MTSQDFWPIRTKSNVDICVWPNPNQMSAYILLEQEEWFEDEMDFVRTYVTPDMNALDIGANHGVYALNIAARAPQGKVWAFEPTLAAGSMLEKSITRNGFTDRLRWIHAGLSDHAGSGQHRALGYAGWSADGFGIARRPGLPGREADFRRTLLDRALRVVVGP